MKDELGESYEDSADMSMYTKEALIRCLSHSKPCRPAPEP